MYEKFIIISLCIILLAVEWYAIKYYLDRQDKMEKDIDTIKKEVLK
jgi:hypothetical protein